ncbi:hypothetical protein TNCV_1365961 [Trichonephila clavipes]|nr:hypothetical protein TNCV_1365961 [Trichonephila clavipes]
MAQRQRFFDGLRWRAVRKFGANQSSAEVVRWLNTSRNVIFRLWNRFNETGTLLRRSVTGDVKEPLQAKRITSLF